MKLLLIREPSGEKCTHGKLYVNGVFECFTLEDVDRKLEQGGEKIYGRTAIPRGSYKVIINFSQRFKRDLPLVLNVPGFTGIRIHAGNTAEDTEGCVLVGSSRGDQRVNNSRVAFNKLFDQLDEAYAANESITLEVA
jgi:Family of unknown function (DUF5675)